MPDTLEWPSGWPRTKPEDRLWGNFRRKGGNDGTRRITVTEAWNSITDEVRRLGGNDLRVDLDRKLNRDGSPHASARQGDDPGAVIHFRLQGRPLVIACDRFQHPESNLRAIAILLEAKRTLARYGFLDMVREFEGYAALPATINALPPLHVILQVTEMASPDVVRAAYKAWVLKNHPDKGGNHDIFAQVSTAYNALMEATA